MAGKKHTSGSNKFPASKKAHPAAAAKFMHGSGAKAMSHKKGSC